MNSKTNLIKEKLDDIVTDMNNGEPLSSIARKLGVKYCTLRSNLEKLGIEVKINPQRKGFLHKESRMSCLEYLNGKTLHGRIILKKGNDILFVLPNLLR